MQSTIKWVKIHNTDEKDNTTLYLRHDGKDLGSWYKELKSELKQHDISPWMETCVVLDSDNDDMCEALKVKVASQKSQQTKDLLEGYLETL